MCSTLQYLALIANAGTAARHPADFTSGLTHYDMVLLVKGLGQPLKQGEVTFSATEHFAANSITEYEGFIKLSARVRHEEYFCILHPFCA